MKKARRGFTLIELLIVVAIIGSLSAMMASSSSDSIDSAAASAIMNNLQSMKTAAYEMYIGEPAVAGLDEVTNTQAVSGSTVGALLGKYLGRTDIAANYGIIGDASSWYVYYTLQASDSAKVKAELNGMANKAGLLGGKEASVGELGGTGASYYDNTLTEANAHTVVALRVR